MSRKTLRNIQEEVSVEVSRLAYKAFLIRIEGNFTANPSKGKVS